MYVYIERPYATSYLIALVILALSFVVCEVFAVEMYMTLALTFRVDQGQM